MLGGLTTRIALEVLTAIQPIAPDRNRTLARLLIILRPAIENDVVHICDVGDVRRLVDDLNILPLINEDGIQALGTEVAILDEAEVARADVVVVIHPNTKADGAEEESLRRQRRPAHITRTMTP